MPVDTLPDPSQQRTWVALDGVDDAEVWIANTNLELNYFLENDHKAGVPNGPGVCLQLALGGEIYVHTTGEGMTVLDVTEAAEWIEPVVAACGARRQGRGRIWVMPENSLVQLLLGLNELISSYRIVIQHEFGLRF